MLLVWPELRVGAARGFLGGVLATQLACLGWALGSSYARRAARDENVLAAAALEMLFGGVCLLVVGALRGEWSAIGVQRRARSARSLYLIVVGSIVGFSAYAYALKHLPVATVSLYAYVNPVIAVVLGRWCWRAVQRRMAIAGGIVLAGVAMVRRDS